MRLPESFIREHQGKSFELMAIASGRKCSVRLKGMWKEVSDIKPKWRVSRGYVPHHLKNLKRGCKLFLEWKLPGFKRDPQFLVKSGHIGQSNTQSTNNAQTS